MKITKSQLQKIIKEEVGKTIKELEGTEIIDEMLLRFLTVKVKKHDLGANYFEKKDDNKPEKK